MSDSFTIFKQFCLRCSENQNKYSNLEKKYHDVNLRTEM